MRFLRSAGCVLACLMFTACGGGGGGGGDSPQARRGAFTLSALSAGFTAKRLGAPPTPQTLTLQITGSDVAAVGAVYRNGVTPPAWLMVSITGAHPTYSVGFSVNTTNLPAGTTTTTVSVGTTDVGGNVLEYKDVAVSYTLNEGVVIVNSVSDVNATLGHSTNSFAKTLSVSAVGKQWQISSDVPWVTATASTSTGSGTAAVTINTSTLPVGSHRATLDCREHCGLERSFRRRFQHDRHSADMDALESHARVRRGERTGHECAPAERIARHGSQLAPLDGDVHTDFRRQLAAGRSHRGQRERGGHSDRSADRRGQPRQGNLRRTTAPHNGRSGREHHSRCAGDAARR